MYRDEKKYSLITGASEGFGKALALECARRSMNLVLVALPGPELPSLAAFIKRNYQVEVICMEKDLCDEASCYELFREVENLKLEVNMLINNAGIGSTVLFEEGNIRFFEKQIKLNVLATTLITRLFLDNLKRQSQSCILNVGSLCSFFYLPKKQVYGATKSYIYFFSKAIRRELAKDNVSVSVVCPGGMNTNPSITLMVKKGSWFTRLSTQNPEEVASFAIDALMKGKEVIIPGRMNKLFILLNKILPGRIKKIMTNQGMNKLNPSHSLTQYLPVNALTANVS